MPGVPPLIADALLVVGFGLIVYGLALVSVPVAVIVGGAVLFGAGTLLSVQRGLERLAAERIAETKSRTWSGEAP